MRGKIRTDQTRPLGRVLTLPELQEGLWNLSVEPRNQLSDEDFERYTQNREFCDDKGSLSVEGFQQMVYNLVDSYRNMTGAWADRKVSRYTGKDKSEKGWISMALDCLSEIRTLQSSCMFSSQKDQERYGISLASSAISPPQHDSVAGANNQTTLWPGSCPHHLHFLRVPLSKLRTPPLFFTCRAMRGVTVVHSS